MEIYTRLGRPSCLRAAELIEIGTSSADFCILNTWVLRTVMALVYLMFTCTTLLVSEEAESVITTCSAVSQAGDHHQLVFEKSTSGPKRRVHKLRFSLTCLLAIQWCACCLQ